MSTLHTIGHSTTAIDTFIQQLTDHDITVLADIRSYPGSRHSPQFGTEALAASLAEAGIDYVHIADLGGRRKKQGVDPKINGGWNNESFHSYADYTGTDSFESGLSGLLEIAAGSSTAYMCAEAVPWRCHRLIVSNVLVARGHTIIHIIGTATQPHVFGAWGATPVNNNGVITYPAGDEDQLDLFDEPAAKKAKD